ncbi:MAG: hypothetical protein F3741_05160 [Nitrospinae bacterium]|nr:hypothetical protein [Nitrospinota bacterium]MZH42086.1 hypothetical protein [Nitrospinota bacterium]
MDQYPKLFIKTSLVYLIIGVSFGVGISFNPVIKTQFSFAHIHINLLGFMVMMIAGVSYHVLPRFASRQIPWPNGVKLHFYLHNLGLLGLVGTSLAGYRDTILFILFSGLTAVSIMIMFYNLFFIFFSLSNGSKELNGNHPHPNCQEDCCPNSK